ncbi:MAG: OB-fold domain-containing protein [Thermoanaerobaculia bacterium]|nr:OB-fold domain-containing protein [Thermoanaerobaculia bacterium]
MSETEAAAGPLPIVPYLRIPAEGDPYLAGSRCGSCGQVFLGDRDVCSSCGGRGGMESIRLQEKGELYVFSIIYRSFPGVETPFISAVVDLEGGGTVKGTLKGIEPDPKRIELGMPVEIGYEIAPRKDREGNEYLTFFFRPATAQSQGGIDHE